MRYRSDIDGLRAVAVVPVVLFHAGLKPFSGGFVGVDVFFVISGYLITSLVVGEIQQGRFSIIRFYERRIRRIFPALFAVLICSSIAAWRLMLPQQFENFANSVFATALFVSNILFWKEGGGGYFAAAATQQPLLHTWSLAVEEQFYILFPPFLFIVHRWLKDRWVDWLAPLALISFAISVWGVDQRPTAAFYLAPARAWELLLGSLLAVQAIPELKSRIWRELGGLFGLGLIAWSVFALTRESPFPGVNALFPAVGAALVIYSATSSETIVSRLLAIPPLVFVGLISYSLYLWHWPLLVFAKFAQVTALTSWQTAAVVGLSFVMAIFSWRFVELPFRRRDGVFRRKPLFASAAFAMSCLVAFGLSGHFSHGWPRRIPQEALQIAAFARSGSPRAKDCVSYPGRWISPKDACIFGAAVSPKYAVWGDSHADALIEMIGKVAREDGQAVKFIVSFACPPVAGLDVVGYHSSYCYSANERAINYFLKDKSLRTIIMVARWNLYIEGFNRDFGPAEAELNEPHEDWITDNTHSELKLQARKTLFATQMPLTVKRLTDAGKTVVLVYPIPETGYNIPSTLAKVVLHGHNPREFTRPENYYFHRQKFVFHVFDKLGPAGKIIRIHPEQRLCDGTKCMTYADGHPLYYDDDHLSLAGADYLSDIFDPLFKSRRYQLH
jgi:peptidoglycan/LPS O-acetylase OafA/YrhL